MKKKRNLVLLAALFAAGVLSMNRLPAKAAGEQAGQEQNAEVQDEGGNRAADGGSERDLRGECDVDV